MERNIQTDATSVKAITTPRSTITRGTFTVSPAVCSEGVAPGLDLVSQTEDAFARNADVTENHRAEAGGPVLEGLAAGSYPVLRM